MAEGGIGDTIMYARYMPMAIAASGGPIVVVCKSKAVAEVFTNIRRVTAITGESALPEAAAWIGMWSLPKLLHPYSEPVPVLPIFGRPDEGLSATLRQQFLPPRRIGICWHGDKDAAAAIYRPSNLDDWKPLLEMGSHAGGIEIWGLQLGDKHSSLPPDPSLRQTADVIRDLDLVITCDGMIAHLAGTIGVPTWMVLHRYGYWPWEPTGESTVWYPSIRIFRETDGWPNLFSKLAQLISEGAISNSEGTCERRDRAGHDEPVGAGASASD
jgi:hypothetical protein